MENWERRYYSDFFSLVAVLIGGTVGLVFVYSLFGLPGVVITGIVLLLTAILGTG